jgi:hypothetical protein
MRGIQQGKHFTVGEIAAASVYMAAKRAEQRKGAKQIIDKDLFKQMINRLQSDVTE